VNIVAATSFDLFHFAKTQIYSLYKNNKNFFHDLSSKDKVERGNIVGERRQVDINDEHVIDLLNGHLGRLITGDDSKFV
jgi:hypothetical protein